MRSMNQAYDGEPDEAHGNVNARRAGGFVSKHRLTGRNELRQEGQIEDRDLRIQHVGEKSL